MVIHADNFCTSNLYKFIRAHIDRPVETDMTMMTFITNQPKVCGIVEVNEQRIMTGYHEKLEDPPGNLANGAVYVWEDPVINYVLSCEPGYLDISCDIVPAFLNRGYTWPADGVHVDIGSKENLELVASLFGK